MTQEAAGAPPSDPKDTSAQVPAVEAGKTQAEEIDLDRALHDEAYLKEVNDRLAQPEEPPAVEPKEEEKAPETAEAKPVEDPDPVVEKVIFRGEEREIRKSRQKEYLQKGMLLDTRLEELSPLIKLSNEAPEVMDLLRSPEGIQKVVARIRRQEQAKAEDELPEIEGYDKDDVKAVDRIVNTRLEQRLKALGIRPEPQEQVLSPADQQRIAWKAQVGLEGLRTVDPEFEGVYAHMGKVLQEAERSIDPKTYKTFVAAINNPEVLNQQTGRPAFMHFYDDVRKDYLRNKEAQTKPAAPVIQSKPRQETSARLTPGAATNPAVVQTQTDWSRVPQTDFDRAFAEALARG